jgi:hypothetical protein
MKFSYGPLSSETVATGGLGAPWLLKLRAGCHAVRNELIVPGESAEHVDDLCGAVNNMGPGPPR